MKKSLEDLNRVYGFAYTEVVARGEKLHPIYLKHLKATWEIETVYDLVHSEQISLGKARELTSGVIEHFVKMPIPTDEEINEIKKKYSNKWKNNNPQYPETDYLSGVSDGMYLLRNTMQQKLGIKIEGDIL